MIGFNKEMVSKGEIAREIAQLVSSEPTKAPVGDQIWSVSRDGFRFDVALKSNGNGSGLYRLTVEGEAETRGQIFTDFKQLLGDYTGPYCLPSGSNRIVSVFWDASKATQRLDEYLVGIYHTSSGESELLL